MKQLPCLGSAFLEWGVNLTVTWHFLCGAWEGIHSSNCIEDKGCHHTHFRWSRFVHPCTYFIFAVVYVDCGFWAFKVCGL